MKHTQEELDAAKSKHEDSKLQRDDTAVLLRHLIDKEVLVKSELPVRLSRKLK